MDRVAEGVLAHPLPARELLKIVQHHLTRGCLVDAPAAQGLPGPSSLGEVAPASVLEVAVQHPLANLVGMAREYLGSDATWLQEGAISSDPTAGQRQVEEETPSSLRISSLELAGPSTGLLLQLRQIEAREKALVGAPLPSPQEREKTEKIRRRVPLLNGLGNDTGPDLGFGEPWAGGQRRRDCFAQLPGYVVQLPAPRADCPKAPVDEPLLEQGDGERERLLASIDLRPRELPLQQERFSRPLVGREEPKDFLFAVRKATHIPDEVPRIRDP